AREFLIDAADGAVLRARDLEVTSHLTGHGRVFDPNPVATLGDPTLQDNADADGPEFAGAYRDVLLPNLTRAIADRFGAVALRGPYARVTDYIESPFLRNPMSSTGDFLFGRDADGFEAVMAYYHVDRTQRYIQSLGFADLNNRDIRVDPHGLRGAKNAHYLGFPSGGGHIAFGQGGTTGGVDLAEDADVIWHEYGHSMQDNQNPGAYLGLGEPGAQGEGFGDYWAFVNTALTSPGVSDPACIGEWAWEGSCLRRTDGTKHYPEDIEREVHADGEIWSAFLTQIAVALGPETANRIILQSHYLVPMFPRFGDGVAAILDADQALYGGAHVAAIADLATQRGFPVAP
ncbi:MAG TPA: M36 family metallopeptidase, partial [Candidatus Polarisedimenticolia bacterium]|nr:M36 family metallopeptidase [Candidatus Polarisedimenticolia bacterium]